MLYLDDYLEQKILGCQRVSVMGVGSVLKADDAAGMMVVANLRAVFGDNHPQLQLIEGSTAPENFTGVLKSFAPNHLFIVDAAGLEEEPGTIGVINQEDIGGVSFSTHMLPFPIMLKYLEHEINCSVSVIGIQPMSTEAGLPVSATVLQAVEELTASFCQILQNKF